MLSREDANEDGDGEVHDDLSSGVRDFLGHRHSELFLKGGGEVLKEEEVWCGERKGRCLVLNGA